VTQPCDAAPRCTILGKFLISHLHISWHASKNCC